MNHIISRTGFLHRGQIFNFLIGFDELNEESLELQVFSCLDGIAHSVLS